MNLYIKNMVCNRCIMVVQQELTKLGLKASGVELGMASLSKKPTSGQLKRIEEAFFLLGFELLDDQKQQQIEKVKALLIEKLQPGKIEEHFRISDYISKKLHKDYTAISRLFSEVEGFTIEQFFILQKIEKVKELLVYGEMNLNEISFNLGYSSSAHLSAQFKKITGLTTGHFKKIGILHRQPLDQVRK